MRTRDVVARMYDAAAGGDLDGFFGAMSDDVVVREPRFLSYGGTYSGKDELVALVSKLAAEFDLSTLKAEYIVADGDRAFAVLRIGLAGSDESLVVAEESRVRDGKVTELRVFVHDGGRLTPAAVAPVGHEGSV